jgi:hypothetical protein
MNYRVHFHRPRLFAANAIPCGLKMDALTDSDALAGVWRKVTCADCLRSRRERQLKIRRK